MLGNRLRSLREEKMMSLDDIAEFVGKSKSTISRYENNLVNKLDIDLIEKFADVLDTSAAYLLGMTEDNNYMTEVKTDNYFTEEGLTHVVVTDDQMEPEIPEGACVQIRELNAKENLSVGSYYYIEFNNKKVFRMVVSDTTNGIGFLPMDLSEQRIAYDKDYVRIIGKAVSMKVFFEDESYCQ